MSYQSIPSDESLTANPVIKPTTRFSNFKVLLLALAFCLVALGSYKAGQWSVLPLLVDTTNTSEQVSASNPKEPMDKTAPGLSSVNTTVMRGKYSVGYFVNWGIYGRKFPPSLIPAQDLTHILYAFANLKADTGEVVLSDKWADEDIHYPGDSWNDPPGHHLYGNFKAIYKLKKQHRHLKVLLSIGGWTYSPSFHPIVVNPTLRANFVRSAIRLLEDYGIDGLDIDYEYPSDDAQARGYVELLKELRHGLDAHARSKGISYKYPLTIAAPCGPQNYEKLHVREMDQYLDFWNMMAYDFCNMFPARSFLDVNLTICAAGSWDSVAQHQANVHGGPISASKAIQWYISQGLPRHKIVMGIPLYGRSFTNTEGPGTPFSGIGPGSWEQGVYDYRALPLPNAHVMHDDKALASWSYDPQKKEMVSFDSENVARWKGEWIAKEKLGGSMFWELSGDKGCPREGMEGGEGKTPVSGESLVKIVKDVMGELDQSPNWLEYERSKFDNLRKGMI